MIMGQLATGPSRVHDLGPLVTGIAGLTWVE